MKLSYKTNAWPELSWEAHCGLADKMELDGLELCYSPGEAGALLNDVHSSRHFLRRLGEKQLEPACITMEGVPVGDDFTPVIRAAEECILLARILRTPYVCLDMDFDLDEDEALLIGLLGMLLPKAESDGVTLLIETRGVYV